MEGHGGAHDIPCHHVPDELRQIAQQRKPWVIVLTETKLIDARQNRVFFQEYFVSEYTLFHSSHMTCSVHLEALQTGLRQNFSLCYLYCMLTMHYTS